LKQVDNKTGQKQLVLRLHQGEDSYQEVPVNKPAGSYDWDVPGESPCYVSLGIKSKDNYTPLLISSELKQLQCTLSGIRQYVKPVPLTTMHLIA